MNEGTQVRYVINNSTGRIENIDSAGEPYVDISGDGTLYRWSGGSPQTQVFSDKVTVAITGQAYIDIDTSISASAGTGLINVGAGIGNTERYKTHVKTYHFTYHKSDL